jgi:hypothetical protein
MECGRREIEPEAGNRVPEAGNCRRRREFGGGDGNLVEETGKCSQSC